LLLDDERYEGIVYVIPSLEKLRALDVRSSLGEIQTWWFGHDICDQLETMVLVASVVTIERDIGFSKLKRLILVSGTFLNIDFNEGAFESLEFVHLECHSLEMSIAELPQSIVMLRVSSPNCPPQLLMGICRLNNIRHLSLDNCRLSYVPVAIGELTTLETLSVRGNFLTIFNIHGERDGEAIPVSNLTSLRCLDISDNICMSLGIDSIRFPESLEYLDVRAITNTYYEPGFYDNMDTPSLKCLYTSRLPSRRHVVEFMQNLTKIVYASPQRSMTAIERMLLLIDPTFPSCSPQPLLYGQKLPTSMDGLDLYIEGLSMPFEDLLHYKDL